MKNRVAFWTNVFTATGILSALFVCISYCDHPVFAAMWDESQPAIEPATPAPQGVLVVYSERYVIWDSNVPVPHRRRVRVYNAEGQLITGERNLVGDGPVRFDLPPGHYIVASESRMQLRGVQVDVQDGRETVVPESRLEQAALFSAPQQARSQQLATQADTRR